MPFHFPRVKAPAHSLALSGVEGTAYALVSLSTLVAESQQLFMAYGSFSIDSKFRDETISNCWFHGRSVECEWNPKNRVGLKDSSHPVRLCQPKLRLKFMHICILKYVCIYRSASSNNPGAFAAHGNRGTITTALISNKPLRRAVQSQWYVLQSFHA